MSNPGYTKARRTIMVLLTILGTSDDKDQCSTVERKGESMLHCGSGTSDGISVMTEKSKGNMS